MRMARGIWLAVMLIFISGEALALPPIIGVTCTPLITPQYGQCNTADVEHIFSGYVCQYETIVADIFSQVYCSVKQELQEPLQLLLTLFVAIFGAGILIGIVPFTQRELLGAVLRIAMLIGFIMQADLVVTTLYQGVIGFMTGAVDVVMSASGGATGQSIYQRIDTIINDFTGSTSRGSGSANPCNESLIPLLVTMMFVIPPLFLMGMIVGFRIIITFLRALVGYLFALTSVMFLTVLSPIFLGAGLFKATRHLFEKWVEYLLSFALQVVVVFAFIGLILSMNVMDDFAKLKNISVPFNGSTWQTEARVNYQNWCTVCAQPNADLTGCLDATPVPPTGMTGFLQVAQALSHQALYLLLLAFLIDAALKLAPSIALSLGRSRTAPQVSGSMFDSISGMGALQGAGQRASQAFMRQGGGLAGRSRASVSEGYTALFRGDGRNPGLIGEFLRDTLGR